MKALLITSELTFVPENYDKMINSSLESPHIVGLIVIKNKDISYALKAIAMILTLAAPRLGWTLLKNFFSSTLVKRNKVCKRLNKKFWTCSNINTNEVHDIIKSENIDLLINARTRSIFKSALLNQPSLGCINIHHGLLPEQRGLMCDFWSHLEDNDFGFSIHQMTTKIDDGPILWVEKMNLEKKNYLNSLLKTSEVEASVIKKIISEIALRKTLPQLNIKIDQIKYRKNPSLLDCYKLQLKGIKI